MDHFDCRAAVVPHFNADPDPHFKADLDPHFKADLDPDPARHLRMQSVVYRPSKAPFLGPTPQL